MDQGPCEMQGVDHLPTLVEPGGPPYEEVQVNKLKAFEWLSFGVMFLKLNLGIVKVQAK